MEFKKIHNAIPTPCITCARTELRILHEEYLESEESHWVYTIPVHTQCRKCHLSGVESRYSAWRKSFPRLVHWCCPEVKTAQIPIPCSTVGVVERAVHAASTAEKGSEAKAHGTFICHLSTIDVDEVYKQSLCAWAPAAIGGYMGDRRGVSRKLSVARPKVSRTSPDVGGESQDAPTAALPSAAEKPPNVDPPEVRVDFCGNPDVQDGAMKGTMLKGDEYGKENRVKGGDVATALAGEPEPRVLARQIGPDLIPTEVMESTRQNLEAGLKKRVDPLPFKADKHVIRKVDKIVSELIVNVFSRKKIQKWREDNPDFMEMGSKKWSAQRFREAYESALADVGFRIEQEFQIKLNEALPAKDKAPRPIIQTGDKGQIAMLLPVKCFEKLLFNHFHDASIKGMSKVDAMKHFAQHMRMPEKKVNCIEGDGSAWDSCCNPTIRGMTENRIMEHIIEVLGEDPQVPAGWMRKCVDDMQKKILKGKAKVVGTKIGKIKTKIRVAIQAIRQSGHRGTSAFNWLINYIGWMVVMCKNPASMVAKENRKLKEWYVSAFDGKWYQIKYKFEGDDSALSTTEDLKPHQEAIEKAWTDMGFRMKLIFGSNKLTFTGFNFLCDEHGPKSVFCPEVPRNVASSSWTTSNEVKQHPEMVHHIGAAAMLARAENFAMCGAFSNYFAQLGLAHAKVSGDFKIGDDAALRLGIQPAESVVARLHESVAAASSMSGDMKQLLKAEFGGMSAEQECMLLTCQFDDPFDTVTAKRVLPKKLWDPDAFCVPRR